MEAHVDQMFWQMVREELRSHKDINMWLEFIANFYEVPQHEFLERIKNRHWAQMQVWTDDRRHLAFLTEVMRAFRAAKQQIDDVDPATDQRRAHQAWLEQEGREFAARMWAERRAVERDAVVPEFWQAFDAQD